MEKKILHLTLKKKWFDMILSGEKKEEYRDLKPYWAKRLINVNGPEETRGENKVVPFDIVYDIVENLYNPEEILKAYHAQYNNFDEIIFRNGYATNAPEIRIECKGISIGKTNPKWSYFQYEVFVIKLGNIIETKNIKH